MEIIEALRNFGIVNQYGLLFTGLALLTFRLGDLESVRSFTAVRKGVFHICAAGFLFYPILFTRDVEMSTHGAIYSILLETTLLIYGFTNISAISSLLDYGIVETQPTDQSSMAKPHQESVGEVAPEKKLTMFAITMSILDLTASGLAFLKCSLGVWMTQGVMVILITVLMSILKVIQIISHSCGVELHHMYNMQQLSHLTHSFSCIFYWLHFITVLASGAVPVVGLVSHDFGKNEEVLVFFYVVATLEALVFPAEMAFWEWNMRHNKLLENAKDECGFETSEIVKRFVYDAYYKCMTGNIFDVSKMNLVTFAEELLVSTSDKEQLMGIRILLKLLNHRGLSNATLGKILTSKDSKVIARLIQMLNLNNFFKEEIRSLAAEIVIMFLDDEEPMMQHMAGMKEAIKSAKLLRRNLTRTERNMVVNEDSHDDRANYHFTWKKCLSPRSLDLLLTSCSMQLDHCIPKPDSVAFSLLTFLSLNGVYPPKDDVTWKMKYVVLFSELCIFCQFIGAVYHGPIRKMSMMIGLFLFSVIWTVFLAWPLTSEEHDSETDRTHKATWNLALNAFGIMALTNALLNLALNAFYLHLNSVANDDADIDQSDDVCHQDSTGEGVSVKNLMMFVIRIGILDLTASGLGLLKYSLVPWKSLEAMTKLHHTVKFITVLTFIFEGIRICCRSRGFELDHMYNIKQLPFLIRFISWLFYCLHLISVLASGVLSFVVLASLNFGKTEEALVFFYVVAFLEAVVFFAKKTIWVLSFRGLFKKVKGECKLNTADMDSIRRFVYNAYYKCVTGYISDVSKMDLVTFAEELIFATSGEEQLMGTRILMKLSTHPGLSDDTLCKIGTSKDVISRLIQMLYLVNYFEENIRSSAAQIISELAKKEPNLKDHVVGMEQAIKSANDYNDDCNDESNNSNNNNNKYNKVDTIREGKNAFMTVLPREKYRRRIEKTHL